MESFAHAGQCENLSCQRKCCLQLMQVATHAKSCALVKPGNSYKCHLCRQVLPLCAIHLENCQVSTYHKCVSRKVLPCIITVCCTAQIDFGDLRYNGLFIFRIQDVLYHFAKGIRNVELRQWNKGVVKRQLPALLLKLK